MIRPFLAVALVVALPLGGCASGGYSLVQGGMSDAVSSFGSDHSLNFTCARYDPATGNLTDQVTVQRALNPNAATVAALAAGLQALAGAIARPAPVPAGERAAAGGAPLTVAACLGEHAVDVPMPVPPNPAPPPRPVQAPVNDHLAFASPDPALQPGRWYEGPKGHVRHLEGVDRDAACWRSDQGAEHCASVRDWRAWVRRPLASPE